MSERYPRIRRYLENGNLALREGLHLCFFMKRSHGEALPAIARALDVYLHTVGRDKLGWYVAPEGECQPLDDKGWEYVRYILFDTAQDEACSLTLREHPGQVSGFRFQLSGHDLTSAFAARRTGLVSAVSFWLPTEYLEEKGPGQVRELAVALARELPLVSGYASLSFNHIEVLWADRLIRELCFQYPGLDVHALEGTVMSVGTGVRGPYWLNFYGQPLLERLGGAEGLRARLRLPEIDVQELGQDKVLVALGEWPIAGNEEPPEALLPYRELTRVLEPHLHEECVRWRSLNPTRMRQWQRRFLDERPS